LTEDPRDPSSKDDADSLLRAVAAAPDRPVATTPTRIAHFRILARLGQGGMGVVYRAEDETLRRTVALKLLPEASGDEETKQRFLREARSAAAITHPNVAVVYQIGEANNRIYIAMELVEGESLRARLDRGRLDLATARELAAQIARGLSAAHEKGIVHRDLKPENVIITPAGHVKILDFGLAKPEVARRSSGSTEAALAKTETLVTSDEGRIMGTPEYMSPEQALGEAVDVRSDVFSFGIVLYEMLAGARPFAGASTGAVLVAIARDAAPPLRERAPHVDDATEAVVARCLAKVPAERFGSAGEIVTALGGRTTSRPATESRTDVEALVATGGVRRHAWSVPWPAMGLVGLACAMTVAAVAGYRAGHLPRVKYCVLSEDTNEGPRCVLEITPALASKRFDLTARFTELGGRVVRLEKVNFAGLVLDNDAYVQGLPQAAERDDIIRNDDGSVREVVARDRHDQLLRWEKWSDGGRRVDLVDDDGTTPRFPFQDQRISTIRRDFDAHGRVVTERFFAPTGRAANDGQGAYGYAYVYGRTDGALIRKTVLGADGKPAADTRGVAVVESGDDGLPTIPGTSDVISADIAENSVAGSDVRYIALDGKPVAVQGVYRVHRAWSEAYDRTSTAYFGLHGESAARVDDGIHEERRRWDPSSRTMTMTGFDVTGRQRYAKGSWGSAFEYRFSYDERGRSILDERLDAQGNPVYEHGVMNIRRGWNDHDDLVLAEHLDANGALMNPGGWWGFARVVYVSDDRGRMVEVRHYDEGGKLAVSQLGGAVTKRTYDARGNAVARADFDAGMLPYGGRGAASERRRFDRMRNQVEEASFGPDGAPCMRGEGWASWRKTYDDDGDEVSVSYFDTTGAPTMYQGDFASERISRDALGLVTAEEYFDTHGERSLRKSGYATVRYVRDRNGDVVEESYFGAHDEPVLRDGAYAKRVIARDVSRRPIEFVLFDAAGKTAGADGWAVEHVTYDDRGLVARQDYFGPDRKPVLTKDHRASLRKTYDAVGSVVEESSLGVDGNPIVTIEGFATKKSTYDGAGHLIEESLLGADGKPAVGKEGWAVRRLRYDAFANLVETAWFDAAHRPTPPKDASYASIVSRFDGRQRLVEDAYFDPTGAPGVGPAGVAAVRYQRDAYGKVTETSYVDGFGAPARSKEDKIVVRTRYDDAGHAIEELFLDGSGAPRFAKDGCSGHRTKYDQLGRKVEESCLGAGDSAALSTDGWALRRTVHDARGNDVEVATYAPDGSLRADKEGIARRKNRFDERSLLLESSFFDASDKPAHDRRGAHTLRFTYDESGKRTGESALDDRGRPVASRVEAAHVDPTPR
jgi:YD repeat-containing protein